MERGATRESHIHMSTATKATEVQASPSLQPCRPLDEAVWNAWLSRNRAEEKRDSAARMRVLKLVALLLLIAAGVLAMLAPNRIGDVLMAMLAGGVSARAAC